MINIIEINRRLIYLIITVVHISLIKTHITHLSDINLFDLLIS